MTIETGYYFGDTTRTTYHIFFKELPEHTVCFDFNNGVWNKKHFVYNRVSIQMSDGAYTVRVLKTVPDYILNYISGPFFELDLLKEIKLDEN